MRRRLETIEEALANKWTIDINNCWIWNRAIKSSGYGTQWFKGKLWPAHRLMYICKFGEPPPNYDICHTCNVKLCINQRHLYAGTRLDNMQQSVREGRAGKVLTAYQVRLIRGLLQSIKFGVPAYTSNKLIGELFGVSYKTIELIQKNVTWSGYAV